MSATGGVDGGGSVQAIGNGMFSIDGKECTLDELVMAIGLAMKKVNDENLATKYSEIKDKLDKQETLNDCLQMISGYNNKMAEDADGCQEFSAADKQTWLNEYRPVLQKMGVKDGSGGVMGVGSDAKYTKAEIKTLVANVQNELQQMSTQNELDMMELNKFNSQNTSCIQLLKSCLDEVKQARNAAAR